MKKILHLSLKKEPFDVMVTGEKPVEFRKPTKWIMSRIVDKKGLDKSYDVIMFVNGYGRDKPTFICEYKGYSKSTSERNIEYSNGLKVKVEVGDIEIHLGKIGYIKNLNKKVGWDKKKKKKESQN